MVVIYSQGKGIIMYPSYCFIWVNIILDYTDTKTISSSMKVCMVFRLEWYQENIYIYTWIFHLCSNGEIFLKFPFMSHGS